MSSNDKKQEKLIRRAERSHALFTARISEFMASYEYKKRSKMNDHDQSLVDASFENLCENFSELEQVPYMNDDIRAGFVTYSYINKGIGLDKELFEEFMLRNSRDEIS